MWGEEQEVEMKAPEPSILPDHKLRLHNPDCILRGAAEKLLSGSWLVPRAAFADLARGSPSTRGSGREALS